MKTIEELSEEYSKKVGLDENEEFIYLQGLKAGVEFAQQWISVNDELPEVGLKIECKNERDSYYCGIVENRDIDHFNRLIVCGMFQGSNAIDLLYNFTHWRPINLK